MMKLHLKLVLLFLLLTLASFSSAKSNYFMYQGQISTYEIKERVDRVAVGNGKIISTSITPTGQLIMVAEAIGDTNLLIWLSNGNMLSLKIYVTEKDTHRMIGELSSAFTQIPKIKIKPLGKHIRVSGRANIRHKELIEKMEKLYEFINLVKYDYFGPKLEQFRKALEIVSGLSITQVEDMIILQGEIEEKYQTILSTVIAAFPDIKILNLTQKSVLQKNTMVYMNVKIVEINNNDLSELGISWDSQITGPNAFYSDGKGNGFPQSSIFQGSFYGLATEITSRINLLVSDGNAVLIAEPRLSAYSGGSARFTAGGQLPIPVTDSNGTTSVEYKDYGILLKVKPVADNFGNIVAHVETEVSSIDKGVTVNGIPGIKTRSTSTDVSMKNQQTLVISGLINKEMSLDKNHIPILGEIPLFSYLFGSKSFRNNQSQLVIFVTPSIYQPDSEIDKKAFLFEQSVLRQFSTHLGQDEIVD